MEKVALPMLYPPIRNYPSAVPFLILCPLANVTRFCQVSGVLSPDPERSEDSVR